MSVSLQDGSLSGNVGGVVSPDMAILDPASCSVNSEWSFGAVEGSVCNSDVSSISCRVTVPFCTSSLLDLEGCAW